MYRECVEHMGRMHMLLIMNVFPTLLLTLSVQQTSTWPLSPVAATGGDGDEEAASDIAEINDGLDLHEGDIRIMTSRDRNIVLQDQYRWEMSVPYVLDESLDLNAKGVALRVFDQIRLKTCIDFKPWEDEPNYIIVIKADGCWSYVGNQRQGNQSLSIGQWCDHLYIVEHEFLHALGFWHEQSRYDRDEYVTVVWENIMEGMEHNFRKHSSNFTTTLGTMYDYRSVMHYSKNAFSNGNGSTIITKLPEFQDVIGQPLEMSPNDVLKLQKLYNCTSALIFLASCSFEDERICDAGLCASGNTSWERVGRTESGPFCDHTSLSSPAGGGFFMHCSTASGKKGDGAKMQSRKMNPKRRHQCLQFFYFGSGSDQDQLNIWMREYETETEEAVYLMGQFMGAPTSQWQLQHVSLNASRPFQVEFEVRKGGGNSSGGISVDDINLSEMECPHHVWHIPNFDEFLTNSSVGTSFPSPRFLTRQNYGLQLVLDFHLDYFGVFFRLVSTDGDDQLHWPCAWRQVTVSLLDQSPHIQQRMSKHISITTDSERMFTRDNETFHYWGNPRKVGHLINDTSGQSYYAGPRFGYRKFLSLRTFWSGNFLKEGGVFFLLSFDDLSSIRNGSDLHKNLILSDLNNVTLMSTDDKETCLNHLMRDPATVPTVISPSFTLSFAVSLPTGTMFSMLTATLVLMST